ncbi:hypothetical protein JZ751_010122 [Albula glossodonta]|uniref:Muscle-restricted coiled-coil protein n=1 Tax=Albula glossodonta TaxID=121402 RepID=A0A8T2N2W3_9TELE|nr:hypothetical protein JZ751_010122 [Albula glossodonta]
MADKFQVSGVEDEAAHPLNMLSLLERVAGIIDEVQACQQRMEERQLELESNVKTIQAEVLKLAKDHTTTSSTVEKLLEKTRRVGATIKDVRVRLEKQNLRVKKVETTQEELLTKNKFRVVIYQLHPGPRGGMAGQSGNDTCSSSKTPELVEKSPATRQLQHILHTAYVVGGGKVPGLAGDGCQSGMAGAGAPNHRVY